MMRRLLAFTGVALLSAALGGLLVAYLLPKPIDQPSPFHRPTPTELALERAVPELNIEPMPFDAALDKLSETWGVEVTANWKSLEDEGFERKSEVELRAQNVTLEEALTFLLRQHQTDVFSPAHSVQRAGIVVDSRNAVDAETSVRIYDVADLLNRPDIVGFYSNQPANICILDPTAAPDAGLFGDSSTNPRDLLVQHLQEIIEPDTWRDNGGTAGSANWLGTRLVVTQTGSNHRAIQGLLATVRQDLVPTEETPDLRPRVRVWDDRVMRFVTPDPEQARWTLHGSIGRFWIDEMPVRETIDLLAERSGAPIFLDVDSLETLDIDLARPVTVHFPEATLYQALRAILRGPEPDEPAIVLNEGVIVIASRDQVSQDDLEWVYTQTRLFDISDFLGTQDEAGSGRASFVEQLIQSLQQTVDPPSWRDNGGRIGAVVERDGQLFVTQTPENLRHVRQVLQELLERAEKIAKPVSDNPASAPSPEAQ